MSDQKPKTIKSFLESTTGIVLAITGLIGAIAALITATRDIDIWNDPEPAQTIKEVAKIQKPPLSAIAISMNRMPSSAHSDLRDRNISNKYYLEVDSFKSLLDTANVDRQLYYNDVASQFGTIAPRIPETVPFDFRSHTALVSFGSRLKTFADQMIALETQFGGDAQIMRELSQHIPSDAARDLLDPNVMARFGETLIWHFQAMLKESDSILIRISKTQ
jgi:hypothetical protein